MIEPAPCYLRKEHSIAGFGQISRTEFRGRRQLHDAATWWRERTYESDKTTEVAFGAFAFDAGASAESGVLLVAEEGREIAFPSAMGPVPSDRPSSALVMPGHMPADAYENAVQLALAAIDSGDIQKVVIARDVLLRVEQPLNLEAMVERLAAGNQSSATFAVDGMIGASPETLVSVRDGRFSAKVLAGTTSPDRAGELLKSAKDLAEHEYAVRSVLEALSSHVTAVTVDAQPKLLELPRLVHLATNVEGRIADSSGSLDLVAALHPTAAVAGTPTHLALALIRELEGFDRGRYSGPVGWTDSSGDGEWAIALRCAKVLPDGSLRAFAGAGIVAGSDPTAELAETELKLRTILDAIG